MMRRFLTCILTMLGWILLITGSTLMLPGLLLVLPACYLIGGFVPLFDVESQSCATEAYDV